MAPTGYWSGIASERCERRPFNPPNNPQQPPQPMKLGRQQPVLHDPLEHGSQPELQPELQPIEGAMQPTLDRAVNIRAHWLRRLSLNRIMTISPGRQHVTGLNLRHAEFVLLHSLLSRTASKCSPNSPSQSLDSTNSFRVAASRDAVRRAAYSTSSYTRANLLLPLDLLCTLRTIRYRRCSYEDWGRC